MSHNTQPVQDVDVGRTLPIIALASLLEFAGLGLQTYGYQIEQAARASIMTFLEIPFSYLLQFVVFNHRPGVTALVGMILIAISGISNIVRKQCHSDPEAPMEEPFRECSNTHNEEAELGASSCDAH